MNTRNDRQEALALRLRGKTYGEIRMLLNVPKSTLSSWFKNIELSPVARKVLKPKQKKGLLALAEFNKQRTLAIQKENLDIAANLESRVGTLSNRDLMLIGAALYWGEGYKNFKKGIYEHINFANSDPNMIRVFLVFLEDTLGIRRNDLKAHIFLYPTSNQKRAIDHWHTITQIPRNQFFVYTIASRAGKHKRPSNLLPYGTLQIRFIRRREFFKIKGLINGIISAVNRTNAT